MGKINKLILVLFLITSPVLWAVDSLKYTVDNSRNDATTEFGTWHRDYNHNVMGYIETAVDSSGIRIPSITIPQGSTIDSAFLYVTANDDYGAGKTPAYVKICCEDTADADTFSTLTDFRGRYYTSAKVDWDITDNWTGNVEYKSPDIKAPFQELVDRDDWVSGNAGVVFTQDDNSDYDHYREYYAYPWGEYPWHITIYYTEPGYEILNPDATSTPDEWANTGGADKVASVTDDVDANFIYEPNVDQIQRFTLANPTSIGAGDVIDSVKTMWRGNESAAAINKARANQILDVTKNTGTEIDLTTDWTDYEDNFTTKPGGGTWTLDDLNDLEVEVEATDIAIFKNVRCTRLYVTVYYSPVVRDTVGRSTVGTISANDNAENSIRGGYYTSDGTGTGDSLYFYLRSSGSHTKNVKGALYDGWLNLIDTTSERAIELTSSYQWFGFALQNSPEIVDGEEYIFAAWSASGTGYCYLARLTASGEARQYLRKTYDGWPDPLGGYKYAGTNYYCYMVYIVSAPPENAPTECRMTTWYSETFDPNGYGDCCPGAPCDEPRYVTYMHGVNSGFSAVSRIDNVDSAWIQIDTVASDSGFWNSGSIEITQIDSADRCEKILLDSAKTIQDGVRYHWRIKFWNSSGWSDWSVDHMFEGVASLEWWGPADTTIVGNDTTISYHYKSRRNIRADTSHDLLYAGYTIPFEMSTGYGKVLSDGGNINSGIPNAPSLDYYEGYSYISYLGDSTSGQGILCVGKYDHGSGEWTQIIVDTISGSGDQVDVHNYPVIIVGDDHKLHLWRGAHHEQALYYRTDSTHAGNGINITDWSGPDTIAGLDSMTYPVPAMDTSGNLYVFFRHYAHGYHDDAHYCYVKSTDNGANWGDRQHIVYYYDYVMDAGKVPSVYNGGVTIDGNNRCHILISWWEGYQTDNLGRGESYVFSDYDDVDNEFKYWRELETADTVGEISTSPDSTKNISYETCSKVDVCASPDTDPIVCPCPNTNCYGIAVYKHPDSTDYLPYFTYFKFTDYKLEETPIYFVKWNGSAWDITNLNTGITPNGPKLWNGKTGAPLVIDGNTVYIYGFVKPSGEEYYGGELVRWRGTELGTNWSWEYFSLNSGKGIGQISVLPYVPSGQKREMVYCRAKDIIWMEDYHFPSMRSDGADIKVVQGYYNNNAVSWTEVHRVPSNAFQLQTTEILFPTKYNIAANRKAPSNRFYQVYWGNIGADPDDIKDDPDSVFQYYESFEAYDTSSSIDGQGEWSISGNHASDSFHVFTSYSGFEPDVWKVWSGDKYLFLDGYYTTYLKCSRGMGADLTDVEIHCHIFTEVENGRVYLELYDLTADKYVRLGLNMTADSAFYNLNYGNNLADWVETEPQIRQDQYYDLRICINSDSGVSGYVNDVLVFDWADTIVCFDTLRVCAYGKALIDGITMTKYVVNSPSPALADGWDSIEEPRRRRLLPSYRGVR